MRIIYSRGWQGEWRDKKNTVELWKSFQNTQTIKTLKTLNVQDYTNGNLC